ncbi:hypothetical protein ACMYR2_2664 [Nitrobacter sp. TKz-YC01]
MPFWSYLRGFKKANLNTVWRKIKSQFLYIFQWFDRNRRASSIHSSSRPLGGTVFSSRSDSTSFSRSSLSMRAS